MFGAIELERFEFGPQSFHVEMQIGDSTIVIEAGELPADVKPWSGSVYVYVTDVDAVHARALALGARLLAAVEDKPYQERQGGFVDAAGNTWWVATYKDRTRTFVDESCALRAASHPAIWRGGDCAPQPDALPTGFTALDEVLPGGGWPGNALTEIVLAREGIGELRLTLPTLAQLTHAGREVVWVAPPYKPHAPALAAAGIALRRLALVRCRTPQEALWVFDQALRAPECGAAFAWLPEHDERVLRRLAVAAREGRTWGVLWRRPGVRSQAIAAPLRLALDAQDGQLAVKVLKRRGGELAKAGAHRSCCTLVHGADRGDHAPPTRDDAASRAPRPPSGPAAALPDRRTSAGQAHAREGLPRRRAGAAN